MLLIDNGGEVIGDYQSETCSQTKIPLVARESTFIVVGSDTIIFTIPAL